MKRVYFDSLRLSEQERQYAVHYIQNNLRLAVVTVIILCLFVIGLLIPAEAMIIPLTLFGGGDVGTEATNGVAMLLISICMLAYGVPLFQFHFLMKRAQSDLYLSLPIERQRLFTVHYLIGLFYLIACVLLEMLVMYAVAPARGSAWFPLNIRVLSVCGVYIVLGGCLYTLFTALIMHCHRLFDGMMITMIYTLLPVICFYAVSYFNYRVQAQVINADVFYANTEAAGLMGNQLLLLLTSLLSIPWQMIDWLNAVNQGQSVLGAPLSWLLIALVAWIIIAVMCFHHARERMVHCRSELSEQPTRSLLTYPLLIPLLTFLMILSVGDGKLISLPLFMIFVAYLIAYCFAQRKLTFDVRTLGVFIAMVLVSSGLDHLAVNTAGFHTVEEIPQRDHIDAMQVDITAYDENNGYQSMTSQIIDDPEIIDEWLFDQRAIVAKHRKLAGDEEWSKSVSFTYYDGENYEVRSYRFTPNDEAAIRVLQDKWQKQHYWQAEIQDTKE